MEKQASNRKRTSMVIYMASLVLLVSIAILYLNLSTSDKNYHKGTFVSIKVILKALNNYYLDYNEYPPNIFALQGNKETYFEGGINDSWGIPLIYNVSANRKMCSVRSSGVNMSPYDKDDIVLTVEYGVDNKKSLLEYPLDIQPEK